MQLKSVLRKSVSLVLLSAGLLTGFSSCKKDKDGGSTPPPPVQSQVLKEFKTGDEFVRFDYNGAGDVNKVTIKSDVNTGGAETTYTITYAGSKIAALETTDEKIVPVYENNVISRADIFQDNARVGYTNYQYQNGLLKKATIYFGQDDEFIPFLEFNFTHNGAGNVTETVVMMATGEPGQMERNSHITYQYDQKANPLYAQRDIMTLFWQSPSKNNITIEDHFDAAQQPEDKFVYTYTYNDKGLPKTGKVTQGLPGQATTVSDINFIYQ